MPNRLTEATSPYLLQHAENPVDWQEWGPPAFAEAELRDAPVLLSVGYSACHWCHVMAHESFEDPETAAFMNEHFVNVKVDREERPDVDRIYMDAVQAMTGQGGWPMTVFLDHKGRPFLAGTYFPKNATGGHPSFGDVMRAVVDAWSERRDAIETQAARLTQAVAVRVPGGHEPVGSEAVDRAIEALLGHFDPVDGGFGGAPKFPQTSDLELLLRSLAMAPDGPHAESIEETLTTTLDKMAAGGIYDHAGGGFARYSVDKRWLVPHFEKMLYDNALLARVYLRAWQVTGHSRYRRIAMETLDYLVRDMTDEAGGIHTAEDADSDGEEGKFYTWTWDEFTAVVGTDAPIMAALFGVTEAGNFEGANILHAASSIEAMSAASGIAAEVLAARRNDALARLFEAREQRVRPGRDDKVMAGLNGLAMRALAEASAILGRPDYLAAAIGIAEFVGKHMIRPDGRLVRSWRAGRPSGPAFCDDYGGLAVGLLTLYMVTGDEQWFLTGRGLVEGMVELFSDDDDGGFFATGIDAEELIARPKNFMDNPTPSDNSLAAEALQLLAAYTADPRWSQYLDGVLTAAEPLIAKYPTAASHLVAVAAGRPKFREIAIVGLEADRMELVSVVWEAFRPAAVIAQGNGQPSAVPLLHDRPPGESSAVAFVCRGFVCDAPVATPSELRRLLAD